MSSCLLRRWLLLVPAVVIAGPACGPDVYQARGVVRDVEFERRQVVIEHEEIPGFMDAMTMSFDVADLDLLTRMRKGQVIDFRIEYDGRRIRVVDFSVRGEAGSGGAASPLSRLVAARRPAPEFELVDQNGEALALANLRGQVVLLDFVFANCPGPCPILTGTHVELQRLLPPDLRERTRFVSISLDPQRDTPDALRAYAEARGADLSGWSFLTGEIDQVDAVLRSYGVGAVRKPDAEIEHTLVTFLIDSQGRIARHYLGLEHEPEELLRDLKELL